MFEMYPFFCFRCVFSCVDVQSFLNQPKSVVESIKYIASFPLSPEGKFFGNIFAEISEHHIVDVWPTTIWSYIIPFSLFSNVL